MDTCIADSISQRTAYILKALGQMQPSSPADQEKRTDYGTFSTDVPGSWAFPVSPSGTSAIPWRGDKRASAPTTGHVAGSNKAKAQTDPAHSRSTKPRGAGVTVKSKSASSAPGEKTAPSCQSTNRPHLPPSESSGGGAWHTGGGGTECVRLPPGHLPHYETFYTPRSYQPLAMFNLPVSESRSAVSTKSSLRGNINGNSYLYGSSSYGNTSLNTQSTYRPSSYGCNAISSYGGAGYSSNSNSRILSGSSSINNGITTATSQSNNSNYEPSAFSSFNTTKQSHDIVNKAQQDKTTHPKSVRSGNPTGANKRKAEAVKCRSAIAHRDSGHRTAMAARGGAGVKKSSSENPDHNNNFYKGGSGIFFCNRKPMPGKCEDLELSGPERINLLAQPKHYPCCHHKLCGDHCGAKKLTPEAMQRISALAQPKLCHYTVCSCCMSPNCLGECSTKFNTNRTSCQIPDCVDWDRLATPRKSYPPPVYNPVKTVKSVALKAISTKRIEKLSVPRKVINSGEYYLWLWKKKPDVIHYLNPIRRLSVAKCDMKDTRVLLRCDLDFNSGKPIDCKVRDALPTMQMALKKGAKSIVIISRCGPAGVPKDPAYSLKPLAQVFEQYLETRVIFLDDCVGFQAQALCEDPVPGSVFLLENLAFHPEELGYLTRDGETIVCKKEDVNRFQKIISDHGDIYITDSFTELVNMTNTTVGYPPKEFGYGFNIKKELSIFNKFAVKPPVPVLAIVAGPFDRTWTAVRNLMGQVSDILVGGHLASVFMRAIKGIELGKTECTSKMEKRALRLFSRAKDTQTMLHLPSDVVVRNTRTDEYFVALTREDIDDWFEIVDIGPHTRQCFTETIRDAAAILWMGDLGPLSDGTETIKAAYLEAAKAGTPTYAADDNVKNFVSIISQPEECLFVTGDGEATESLLRGHIPKGLSVLSKSRRKVKREPIPEVKSTKPVSYELPGMVIPGGTKVGASYGASHSLMCINHVPVENMKVLIRVEFNEPMADHVVTNNYRMRMTIPTIKYALKWRARAVVVLAHFREPQGRRDSELSLKPICDEMASLLGETVIFVPRTVGKDVMTTVNQVHPGSILMVENVRFHPEEEQGFLHMPDGRLRPLSALANPAQLLPSGYTAEMNAQFCEELSRLGDIFVNDAFGALHLDHASITGNFRPTRVCGFLVKNELKYLAKLLNYPNRKFLVILGGTNVEDKLDILPGILKEADSLILAGTMACLFLKVEHNLKTGRMVFSEKHQERAKEMIQLATYYKCRIHYPVDLAVSLEPDGQKLKQVSISEGIPPGYVFVDIGKLSAPMFTRIIKRKHMIFWTGAAGNGQLDYELSSTKLLMEALYAVTHDPEKSAVTIVGGRGLSQIVEKYDPEHEAFTHLTTGGRVALQLLAQRHVIGLDSLLPRPGKRPLSLLGVNDYTEFRDSLVLIRCDLDLPMEEDTPVNTFPLQHLSETVKYIQKKGAKAVFLLGHRGDPDGQEVESLSLMPLKSILEGVLEQTVDWAPAALTAEGDPAIAAVQKGSVVLLENVCFHPEEAGYMRTEAGDRVPVSHEDMAQFRSRLVGLADVFVNESFSTLHRAYSSVVGIAKRPCIAGASLKRQIYDYVDIRRQLDGAFLLILGSETVEDIFPKLLLLLSVLDLVELVYLCGNMASVFKSSAAQSSVKQIREAQMVIPRIVRKARLNKVSLVQQADSYAARDPSNPEEEPRVVQLDANLPKGYTRCDMGPQSIAALTSAIRGSRLVVLCGPTGTVQWEHHQRGTRGILDQIAAVTSDGSATSVALGMRTGQFLHQLGHVESFSSFSVDPEPFFEIMIRRPLAGLQILDRMPANPLKKLSIEQMNLSGRRVLLRLDLDVPSVEGVVLDTDKLEDAAPTIAYALQQGGAKCVILLGHRGEPGGYKNYYLRMEPLVVEISAILGMDVHFIDRPCSKKAKRLLEDPPFGSVFLMENLKFYPAESGQDAEPRRGRSSKRPGETSLTEVSELPKDEALEEGKSEAGEEGDLTPDELEQMEEEEEAESISNETLSVSDGEGGQSVDSLMYQLMRPKTVEQFTRDLAACGDVFINDDVAHVEEALTSYAGFGLPERGCGLLMSEFLRDSEEASVYQLPGVESLSNAP